MQKQNSLEYYNNKLTQNYYDNDRIRMRNHPLDSQRILYLYEMLNIFIVADDIQVLPIRENILEKLKIIKRLTDTELSKRDLDYLIANESVQKLKGTVRNIREKIPRMANNLEFE